MKIAILTLPLYRNNYGGILQNYALQTILKKAGHDVVTINMTDKTLPLSIKIGSIIKQCIRKFILLKKTRIRGWLTQKENEYISHNINSFIKQNISLTKEYTTLFSGSLKSEKFDCYIVGSDQCWRPIYLNKIENYFLDFTQEEKDVNRIAYAASFGVDFWDFNEEDTQRCSNLIQQFNAVSVREESGILLCEKNLNIKAIQTLDPTLLLSPIDYNKLISEDDKSQNKNIIFSYILDLTPSKVQIQETIRKKLNLEVQTIMPKYRFKDPRRKKIEDCLFPSVSQWIQGFASAQFIITDSFHGTVFALLFNKPFITIGNKTRGLTRFTSLLQQFGLSNRLITKETDLTDELIYNPINFENVNQKLKQAQAQALQFLEEALINKKYSNKNLPNK